MILSLKRFISRLVLVSFIFQTVWPSWLAASPLIKEVQFEHNGLKQFLSRLSLGVQIDDQDDRPDDGKGSFFKDRAPLEIHLTGGLEGLQRSLILLNADYLYPGLQVAEHGFSWSQYGFAFTLNYQGRLLVSAEETKTAGYFVKPSRQLRLFNPHGSIVLGQGLNLDKVWLSATDIHQAGQAVIHHLEVESTKLTGEASDTALFTVDEGAKLTTRHLTLHQGGLTILGTLSLEEKGVLEAKDNPILNQGTLEVGLEGKVHQAKSFENEGTVIGKSLTIENGTLTNTGTLELDHLQLKNQSFYNNGKVVLKKWKQDQGEMANAVGSTFTVTDQSQVAAEKIINKGRLNLKGPTQGTVKVLTNQGSFTLETSPSLAVQDFFNRSLFEVKGPLVWQGERFKSDKTVIFHDKATITVPLLETGEDFTALSDLTLNGNWHHQSGQASLARLFFNGKKIENGGKVFIQELPEERQNTGQKIKELINESTTPGQPAVFTIQKGGARFDQVVNRQTLILQEGWYQFNQLDNNKGTLQVDWLIPNTHIFNPVKEWTLTGKITARSLSFSKHYQVAKVINQSQLICDYIDFQVGQFINRSQLTYDYGSFEVGEFINEAQGSITVGYPDSPYQMLQFLAEAFVNQGRFTSQSTMNWKGKSFKSTKEMVLQKGGVIDAPLIETGGTFTSHGDLTLQGDWTHKQGTAGIAKLFFKGRKIVNGDQITLQDFPGQKYRGQTIAELMNGARYGYSKKAKLHIVKGGASFGKATNYADLILAEGHYYFKQLENAEGTIEVDWFCPEGSGELTLTGQLHAKSTSLSSFKKITNKGKTVFDYAVLKTDSLKNDFGAALTIGRGDSVIGSLKNKSLLTLTDIPTLKVDAFNNKGTIQSPTSLRVLLLDPSQKEQSFSYVPTVRVKFKDMKLTSNNKYDIVLGILKAQQDLILEMAPPLHLAESLYQFNDNWHCSGVLRLYGEQFVAEKDVTRCGAVFIKVDNFENEASHLTFRSLEVQAEKFRNGKDNQSLGNLETKKDSRNPHADTSLKITAKTDLDNRYGQLFGHGKLSLTSKTGTVLIGEKKTESQQRYNFWSAGGTINYAYQKPNGSYACSNGDIKIEGQNLTLCLAEIRTASQLFLQAEKTVKSVASQIFAQGDITISGQRFDHEIFEAYYSNGALTTPHGWQTQLWYTHYVHLQQSDPAVLQSLGDIHFETPVNRNYGSQILAAGDLRFDYWQTWQGTENCPFVENVNQAHHHRYKERDVDRNIENWYTAGLTVNVIAQVQAGKRVKINAKTYNQSGYLSGKTIEIKVGNTTFKFLGQAGQQLVQAIIDTVESYAKNAAQSGGFIRQLDNGTVRSVINFNEKLSEKKVSQLAIAGQKNPGLPQDTLLFTTPSLDIHFLQQMLAHHLGRLYYNGLSGEALYMQLTAYGEEYAKQGALVDLSKIQADEPFLFYQLKKAEQAKTLPEAMVAILSLFVPKQLAYSPQSATARSENNIEVLSDETIELEGARLRSEEGDVLFQGKEDLIAKPAIQREGSFANYVETFRRTYLEAPQGQIKAEFEKDIFLTGVQTESGQAGTHLKARGNLVDQTAVLQSQQTSQTRYSKTVDYRAQNIPSLHFSKGDFLSTAGGYQNLFAPVIKTATKINIVGLQGVGVHEVHDKQTHDSTHRSGGGAFGQSRTKTTQTSSSHSVQAVFESPYPLEILAGINGITLTGGNFQVSETILTALEGDVQLKQGSQTTTSSTTDKKSNLAWQSQHQRQEVHQTYSPTQFAGPVTIYTPDQVIVEQVAGQLLPFMSQIDIQQGTLEVRFLQEIHDIKDYKTQGLSTACAAVIALAAGMATYGTGQFLAGALVSATQATGTTASLLSSMSAAGFSGLCSQAAVSLVNHQGHLESAALEMVKKDSLRTLMKAMVIAGAIQGIGQAFDLPITAHDTKGLTSHLQRQALHQGVSMAVDMVVGVNSEEAVKKAVIAGMGGVVGGFSANVIGQAYADHMVDIVTHKLLHAASAAGVGALTGAAMGHDAKKMALSAAIGATTAEIMADILNEDSMIVAKRVEEKATERGLDLNNESHRNALIYTEIRSRLELSKFSGAMATFLSGQDVGAGTAAAAIAIENNFAQMAKMGVLGALKLLQQGAKFIKEAGIVKKIAGDGVAKTAKVAKITNKATPIKNESSPGAPNPDPHDDQGKDHEGDKFSKETKDLLGETDTYKEQLFERGGKSKEQTTLGAAKRELAGEQIPLATERGKIYDHVTKVKNAQDGLLDHIGRINRRLGFDKLLEAEKRALEQELSNASRLLDHTETFVPRS